MKYILLTIFISILSIELLAQNAFKGDWEGAFIREGSIQITQFHFDDEMGQLNGYHHIPERELYFEPLENMRYSNDTLYFKCRYGDFLAVHGTKPQQLLGLSIKWNPKIKLHLKKSEREPIQLISEEYIVKNDNIELSAQLIRPHIQKAYDQIIILVHGSGETIKSDRYYRTIGVALAKRGYNVVIYDKRGCGSSTGSLQGTTFSELAEDANAVLNETKSKFNNDAQFGFMGISQGGWISTIAASTNINSDFLILNVGPAVSLFQQEIDRIEYSLKADGFEEDVVQKAVNHVKLMFELIDNPGKWDEYIKSSEEIKKMGLDAEVNFSVRVDDDHISWWRSNKYDPEYDLKNLKIPVLSLFGGSDNIVPPSTNGSLMEFYLKESQSPHYQINVFENGNHDLETYQRLEGDDWKWPSSYWVWPKKSEGHYSIIEEFLSKVRKLNK